AECNRPRSAPRRWHGKSPPAWRRPAADRAAARRSGGRGPSSRHLPGGAVLGVLQHHTHFRKSVADAVGLFEVFNLTRVVARRDPAFDLLHRQCRLGSVLGLPGLQLLAAEPEESPRARQRLTAARSFQRTY